MAIKLVKNNGKVNMITPNISVNLTGYATEEYVDNAIAEIPEVDLSNYYTKDYIDGNYYIKEQTETVINNAIRETEDFVEAINGSVIMEETYLDETLYDRYEWCFYLNISNELILGNEYEVILNGEIYTCIAEKGISGFTDENIIILTIPDVFTFEYYNNGFCLLENTNAIFYTYFYKEGYDDTLGSDNKLYEDTYLYIRTAEYQLKQDVVKQALPFIELVATLEDGTTKTYTIYGNVKE